LRHNPKDPLLQKEAGPEAARELFAQLTKVVDGFPNEVVANAGGNLIINSIRQRYAKREDAEAALRDLFGKIAWALLEQHYDGHGRRKGVFPYDQVITAPRLEH
jgi:hypothetical protein